MASKKPSLMLSTIVLSFFSSAPYGALADDNLQTTTPPKTEELKKGIGLPEKKGFFADDSWIKNREKTFTQQTAEKQKAERMAELDKAIGNGKNMTTESEKKTEEAMKNIESKPPEVTDKPASKPRLTWQEEAKQRREDRLKRERMQANKAPTLPPRPSTSRSAVQAPPSATSASTGEDASSEDVRRAGELIMALKKNRSAYPTKQEMVSQLKSKMGVSDSKAEKILEAMMLD